ncbi:flagellin [Heliophilum fasciatum]|uniref:Flagellin n=1 Tax=Heliophilum fasciatum TaxID=35700 RepID=A0A4R2RCT9_9FIRM|nr:flagellin [Heliophilum fasciatum]MCW2279463.1 flagellin [Heliophilum fasciatum]TCP59787.1 flagellin [Heliophilum fasciatum]
MRINHNIAALNTYRQLSQNQAITAKHLEKLSSGLRINHAADDAAGLAISETMRSQIRGLDAAERNTLDGISLLQTAEGALDSVHQMLQRMRELAVQAANDTYMTEDRTAIQSEIDQLTKEIDRVSSTTEFNGRKLLNGDYKTTGSGLMIQLGPKETQTLEITIDDVTTANLKINNIDVSNNTNAGNAITSIADAITAISTQRSKLGALQNRMEHTVNNLKSFNQNLTASESRIRDADMALEMANFTKNNIISQAATAMLAQANQLPQGILQLLK